MVVVLTCRAIERRALTLRLDFAMTQTEIAQRLNCSQMQVSRLLHRAAGRLHQLLDRPLNERELSAAGRDQTGTHATARFLGSRGDRPGHPKSRSWRWRWCNERR
jgi:transcriptional regulator with XRE-family HTH domain